jgi:anti-sigma regulatory factor (Ser/Thr protein kinase)
MLTVLRVRLPPDPSAPRLARAALQGLPRMLHSRLEALRLMVTELVTNSITHVDLAPVDRIELVVRQADDHLRVEVKDPGAGYTEARAGWELTQDHGAGKNPSSSGYGLVVVTALADRSGVSTDHGTVVWFELDLDETEGDGTST